MTTPAYIGGVHEYGQDYMDTPGSGVYQRDVRREVIGEIWDESVLRQVLCLKSDVVATATALRGLAASADLVCYVGKDSPLNFGSGWQCADAGGGDFSPSLQVVSALYTRTRQGVFDFDLPDGLEVACSGGVVTVTYNSTLMRSWTTELDCTTPSLYVTGKAVDSGTYRIVLYACGLMVDHWDVTYVGTLDPEHVAYHRLTWEASGTSWCKLKLCGTVLMHFVA